MGTYAYVWRQRLTMSLGVWLLPGKKPLPCSSSPMACSTSISNTPWASSILTKEVCVLAIAMRTVSSSSKHTYTHTHRERACVVCLYVVLLRECSLSLSMMETQTESTRYGFPCHVTLDMDFVTQHHHDIMGTGCPLRRCLYPCMLVTACEASVALPCQPVWSVTIAAIFFSMTTCTKSSTLAACREIPTTAKQQRGTGNQCDMRRKETGGTQR